MDKIKVGALGIFDEQKFKKLASDREDWLNGGEDMLLNNNFRINKIASELKPNQTPALKVSMNRLNHVLPPSLKNDRERGFFVK